MTEAMFIAVCPHWLRSGQLQRLRKPPHNVSNPLEILLLAWEHALLENAGPEVDLEYLEDVCGWEGPKGGLIAALQSTGHLDGNRLSLWWNDGPGKLIAARERWRKSKAAQRAKKATGYPQGVTEESTRTPLGVHPESTRTSGGKRPPPHMSTRTPTGLQGESPLRVEESRVERPRESPPDSQPNGRALARGTVWVTRSPSVEWAPSRAEALVYYLEAVSAAHQRDYGTTPLVQDIYDRHTADLDPLAASKSGGHALQVTTQRLNDGRIHGGPAAAMAYLARCNAEGGATTQELRRAWRQEEW